MLLEVRLSDRKASDALQEFTHRRLARALRRFQSQVARVEMRITDVNGPGGGIDKRCSASVALAGVEQRVVVQGEGTDAYAAVQDACTRLGEAVSWALGGRAHPDRFDAAAPTAAAFDPESHITVTELDYERLQKLIRTWSNARDRDAKEALADELGRAEVVPVERVAGSLATMNSRVVFRDEESGESREVSLVYPRDSDPDQGRISVLSPIGSALLGLSVGQTIDWPLPNGRLRRIRVVEVAYQPEAAGDFHL